MKNFLQNIISTVCVVLCAIVLQSCSVYHTNNSSIDEAVAARKPVKVVTDLNATYEFKTLERQGDRLLGVTKKNSFTAKKMPVPPVEKEGDFLKFELDQKRIYGLYLKNRKLSNAVTFGVPVVSAAGLIGITSPEFRPNIGN